MLTENEAKVIGDYFTLQRGNTYKSHLLGKEGPVLLGLATIQRNGGFRSDSLQTYGGESPEKLLVYPGEMYLSLKDVTQTADLLGAVARLPSYIPVGRLTQDTVKLQPKYEEVPVRFLYWLLQTPQYRDYCRLFATGTTNLGLSREDFLAFPVPKPTALIERLVDLLDAIDEKLELNRRMNETLEAMARAIFKSWFVDFDPVRAKAEGRTPAGMDAETAALFPDSFVDSALGEIPAGWKVSVIGDIAHLTGKSVSASELSNHAAYIGLDHMPRRSISLPDWGMADQVTSNKTSFNKGDILFGKLRPYFHKVGVAPIQGVCSTDILVVNAIAPEWFGFVIGHLSDDDLINYTDMTSGGTKMPRTSWGDISNYEVVLPNKSVATCYNDHVTVMIQQIIANIFESHTLSKLRDILLPKLLSGEVRVNNLVKPVNDHHY